MNKINIIKKLNEKDMITTKELTELGFNSHMISKLVDSGFIVRKERGVYTHGSIESMLSFGNELLKSKDKDNSKLVFDYCYKLEPENYVVNLQQLYNCILLRKNEDVFKYFKFVYDYLKNNNREKDAYYILFMYSYCFDIPKCYINDYKKFLNSNIRADESDNNELRESVYIIDFNQAYKIVCDGKNSFDNTYESMLEKVFIYRAQKEYYYKNNYVKQNLENGNYSKTRDFLKERDKKGLLNYSQKQLLYLIDSYLYTFSSGKILEEKEVSNNNNFYLCIECNQFALAKSLLDNYYNNNPNDNKNSNVFYMVLDKYVELINTIKYEVNKKKMLSLDNMISMIIDGDYSLIDEYLKSINKGDYCFLIDGLIKLSKITNNRLFIITTLISITTGEYKFNINNFVSLYFNSLQNKDFERAKIFLDIISNSSHISNINIENSMRRLYSTLSFFDNKQNNVLSNTGIVEEEGNYLGNGGDSTDIVSQDVDDNRFSSTLTSDNDDEIRSVHNKENNSFEDRIRNVLDSLSEQNPLVLLPTVKSEDEMDEIFDIIDNDYPNITSFVINTSNGSQAVARYKVMVDEYIDFKELYASAKNDYIAHRYNEALPKFIKLLTIGNPHPAVYGMYGLCLRNMGKKDDAITALTVATGYSKLQGGDIDFSDAIFDLTHYGYNDPDYEKKPFVDIRNYDPDDHSFGRRLEFLDDLIVLVKEGELDLESSFDKLNLSEEDRNYARLIYARDCYYVGSIELGDKYLNIVEKSKSKSSDNLTLLDEVRRNKKFYQNRLDEDRKKLVLMN